MSAVAGLAGAERGAPGLGRIPWTALLRGASLLAVVVALAAGAILGEPQAIAVALPLFAICLAIVWRCFAGDERRFLLTLFLVAYGLRMVGAVASHFVLLYLGRGGFALMDDRAYDKLGYTLARVWQGVFPGIRDSDEYLLVNYTYLVAIIYYLLGKSLLAAKMMNVAFGALLAIVGYALGREIFDLRAARITAVLTAFFPSLLAWSVINLKDIMVVLLTATAIFGLLRYARRHRWWALALALAAFLAIENLRQFVFFILAWLLPIAFLFADRSAWRRKLLLLLPLVVGVVVISVVTNNEKLGLNYLRPKALTEAEWKRWLEESRAATGNEEFGGIKPPKDASNIVERSLAALPRGVFYVLFGPTPWQARSGLARAVIPEMLAWYALLAAALVGLARSWRRHWRDLLLPLAFSGAWIVALALTEGNAGNIFRHRSMFMPFVFLTAAPGLLWAWSRWVRPARPTAEAGA